VVSRASSHHVVVATFDHRTGQHASEAARFVVQAARARGLPAVSARAPRTGRSEDDWRRERWRFLREIAHRERARVATAHTEDDHAETLVMRVLRGSGARGLAGLRARSEIVRPFLEITRKDITAFARDRALRWVEDPTNLSRAFHRNRVRLDLIPAFHRAGSSIVDDLLRLSVDAARVREALDVVAKTIVSRGDDDRLRLSLSLLRDLGDRELRALWPSIAAMAGIRLDRRGTVRLAEFTIAAAPAGRVQVTGGGEVYRHGAELVVAAPRRGGSTPVGGSTLRGRLRFGGWRFIPRGLTELGMGAEDAWCAALPGDCDLRVRSWRPGDRMRYGAKGERRRIKRFLADAKVPALDRNGWPVVTANGEIVWIPGVRRSPAATVRSGRSVVHYRCERFHG
jgi:tRNA(Ile)-lysidine synthase